VRALAQKLPQAYAWALAELDVLTTALANKLARIAWSVVAQHRFYEARVSIGAKATASKDNATAIGNGATSAGFVSDHDRAANY
jgi:hypothetical protein